MTRGGFAFGVVGIAALVVSSAAAQAQTPPSQPSAPPAPTSTAPAPPSAPPTAAAPTVAPPPSAPAAPSPGAPPPATTAPPGYAPQPAPQGYGQPPPGYARPGYPPGYTQPPPYYYYPPPGYYPYPYQPLPPPVPKKRRSTAMMGTGIALTAAGAIGLIVGAVLETSGQGRTDVYCDSGSGAYPCDKLNDTARVTGGTVTMIVSGVALAVGIPLWIVGAQKIPIKKEAKLFVTPRGAAAALSF